MANCSSLRLRFVAVVAATINGHVSQLGSPYNAIAGIICLTIFGSIIAQILEDVILTAGLFSVLSYTLYKWETSRPRINWKTSSPQSCRVFVLHASPNASNIAARVKGAETVDQITFSRAASLAYRCWKRAKPSPQLLLTWRGPEPSKKLNLIRKQSELFFERVLHHGLKQLLFSICTLENFVSKLEILDCVGWDYNYTWLVTDPNPDPNFDPVDRVTPLEEDECSSPQRILSRLCKARFEGKRHLTIAIPKAPYTIYGFRRLPNRIFPESAYWKIQGAAKLNLETHKQFVVSCIIDRAARVFKLKGDPTKTSLSEVVQHLRDAIPRMAQLLQKFKKWEYEKDQFLDLDQVQTMFSRGPNDFDPMFYSDTLLRMQAEFYFDEHCLPNKRELRDFVVQARIASGMYIDRVIIEAKKKSWKPEMDDLSKWMKRYEENYEYFEADEEGIDPLVSLNYEDSEDEFEEHIDPFTDEQMALLSKLTEEETDETPNKLHNYLPQKRVNHIFAWINIVCAAGGGHFVSLREGYATYLGNEAAHDAEECIKHLNRYDERCMDGFSLQESEAQPDIDYINLESLKEIGLNETAKRDHNPIRQDQTTDLEDIAKATDKEKNFEDVEPAARQDTASLRKNVSDKDYLRLPRVQVVSSTKKAIGASSSSISPQDSGYHSNGSANSNGKITLWHPRKNNTKHTSRFLGNIITVSTDVQDVRRNFSLLQLSPVEKQRVACDDTPSKVLTVVYRSEGNIAQPRAYRPVNFTNLSKKVSIDLQNAPLCVKKISSQEWDDWDETQPKLGKLDPVTEKKYQEQRAYELYIDPKLNMAQPQSDFELWSTKKELQYARLLDASLADGFDLQQLTHEVKHKKFVYKNILKALKINQVQVQEKQRHQHFSIPIEVVEEKQRQQAAYHRLQRLIHSSHSHMSQHYGFTEFRREPPVNLAMPPEIDHSDPRRLVYRLAATAASSALRQFITHPSQP